jgi:hypothetical protein
VVGWRAVRQQGAVHAEADDYAAQGHPQEKTIPYHVIEELPTALDAQGNRTDILTLPWVRFQGAYDDGFIDPA